MSRFTIVTITINVLLVDVYNKYIKTYNTSVSMGVKFNLYQMIKGTIQQGNSDNRT